MASSSSTNMMSKKDQMYACCAEKPPGTVFSQADLVAFGIAADLPELVALTRSLYDSRLFQYLTLDSAICYRIRSREDAARLAKLDGDNLMVYSAIESAATTGIWTKTLKARTNLHQTAMTKALKTLESAKYVKPIKSVKFPGRKLYMLYDLNPAEDVTGGSWFSDGELDIDFVESLGDLIVAFVKKMSWREGPKMPRSAKDKGIRGTTEKSMDNITNGAVSAINDAANDIEMTTDFTSFNLAVSVRDRILTPHPPGYKDYPTATSILDMVDSTGILQGKDLELQDLIHLLDALVFDARLERVGRRVAKSTDGDTDLPDVDIDADADAETEVPTREARIGPIEEDMYRWVRKPFNESSNGPGNGWSEAPCSRCPVFRLCEEGGPVDARNCGYFEQWLAV